MTAVITHVKRDGCCCSGIACVYYGGGRTCSLFISKQTLVQYKEEKKKEKKMPGPRDFKPHPSLSLWLGNMTVAYAVYLSINKN